MSAKSTHASNEASNGERACGVSLALAEGSCYQPFTLVRKICRTDAAC